VTRINLVFFASIRERLGSDGEALALAEGVATVAALKAQLCERGEPWASVLADPRLLVAVNQEMVGPDAPVKAEDEVAFFPPVTGG
jgi:molybdopterin synthase sulfur carrier subunit